MCDGKIIITRDDDKDFRLELPLTIDGTTIVIPTFDIDSTEH